MKSYDQLLAEALEQGFHWRSECGCHPGNRSTWCDVGCGSDYNRTEKCFNNDPDHFKRTIFDK